MDRHPRTSPSAPRLEALVRAEWGRLVATAARLLGDLDAAEEVAQGALVAALERWPASGVPDRPGAWLATAVKHRAIDELRRQKRLRAKHAELAVELPDAAARQEDGLEDDSEASSVEDDTLRLVFTCCHPALSDDGRVALTLRLLGGLSTRDIARAFLVPEATISQRIVRAKRTIKDRALPYRVPGVDELAERLPGVLEVIYLIFNEGYAAREGDALVRRGLCDEAIRLATTLAGSMPAEPEVLALLALLEFQASRLATRSDAAGQLILLQDQDRTRWDRVQIERATRHLERAREAGALGRYGLQALIAECHARAPSWEETDWARIVRCYDALIELTGSPVVRLNRAVAVAAIRGPAEGLALVDELAGEAKLAQYALLPATRADLLRRLGRPAEAAEAYRRALALTANERERDYLERRLAECGSAGRRDA